MSLFQSFMPGFREIRAPVISGLLWLFVIYLAFPDIVPRPDDGEFVKRAYDVGNAIGPLGVSVVTSVSAYLIGSIIRDAQIFAWRAATRSQVVFGDAVVVELEKGSQSSLKDLVVADRSASISRFSMSASRFPSLLAPLIRESYRRIEAKAWALIVPETRAGQLEIEAAADFASKRRITVIESGWDYLDIEIDGDPLPLRFPVLPTPQRLLQDGDLIRARLSEYTPETSFRVERVFAESELRVALALPLTAMVIAVSCLVCSGRHAWLLCLALPLGLLGIPIVVALQGAFLRLQAIGQMIDAVRTRSAEMGSERFTPLFSLYLERCATVATRFRQAA